MLEPEPLDPENKSATSSRQAGKGSVKLLVGKPVGAVVSAVRILRLLAKTTGAIRGSRIAKELGLNISTCFNILQTLAAENLVRYDPETKRYRLGFGLLDLASSNAIMGGDLSDIRLAMQEVSDAHDVTMSLWRRVSEIRMLLIMATSSARQTRVHMAIGQRLPLLVGSTGRAMAAMLALGKDEIRHYFNEIRWIRPLNFETYYQEVLIGRERGWTLDTGDFVNGLHSISAAVTDERGAPLLVCTATLFSGQYSDERGEQIGRALVEMARRVRPLAQGLE
ncbi:MAG: IclR family transcriptional regulator [Reyranella sp.]|uniref:IclR family transcriptional regulator n=1 Tax=Reyranella sp. TaxID=1929291 RepID=UPI001201F8F0|nr:IclR family transcriptional regulator C-terminal domain-containing protein [Reyranella sp.]TAJ97831.1 MAG: IclR family transcriptional regulator [Reyranella sp.]TBR27704.1 MAG: IclR family transcriptional regulator [Reyranella sp.]